MYCILLSEVNGKFYDVARRVLQVGENKCPRNYDGVESVQEYYSVCTVETLADSWSGQTHYAKVELCSKVRGTKSIKVRVINIAKIERISQLVTKLDAEIVRNFVSKKPHIISVLTGAARKPELIELALQTDGSTLRYLDVSWEDNQEKYYLLAVKSDGMALQHIPVQWALKREICSSAIHRTNEAIGIVCNKIVQSQTQIMAEHPTQINISQFVVLLTAAVSRNGYNIRYVDEDFLKRYLGMSDEESGVLYTRLCKLALRSDVLACQFIKNPSEQTQVYVARKSYNALLTMQLEEPCEEVRMMLDAITRDTAHAPTDSDEDKVKASNTNQPLHYSKKVGTRYSTSLGTGYFHRGCAYPTL